MDNKEIVYAPNEMREQKGWALDKLAIQAQIFLHVANLFTYFHIDNESSRVATDKHIFAGGSDIVEVIIWMLQNNIHEDYLNYEFKQRQYNPIYFRIAQLVEYYGKAEIRTYLSSVFGKEVA